MTNTFGRHVWIYSTHFMFLLKMEKCSIKLGVPVNCIFPVRNYHEEIELDEDMDVLLFRALKQMVDFGDDFLKEMEQS